MYLKKILSLTIAISSISLPGHAQEQEDKKSKVNSTYVISGSCSSKGTWTQDALANTSKLKDVYTSLKNNPACAKYSEAITSGLTKVEESIKALNKNRESAPKRLSQLPKEIASIRNFSRDSRVAGETGFSNQVIQLLMGKMFEKNKLTAEQLEQHGTMGPLIPSGDPQSFDARIENTAASGLTYLNSMIGAIQEADENCLDQPSGLVASGMIQTLAAFAGSGQDGISTSLSLAVNNLFTYFGRNKKYIEAIRKLNDREFITSMSCLIEYTSESYCSALDGRYLLDEILKQSGVAVKQVPVEHSKTNNGKDQNDQKTDMVIVGLSKNFKTEKMQTGPLAGYYILTNQMQIVNDWIQKVQYGNTPQLPTEATFQTNVMTSVLELNTSIKKIEGDFNYALNQIDKSYSQSAKQNQLKQAVLSAFRSMIGNSMSRSDDNFFLRIANDNELMFQKLLGAPIPDEVAGKNGVSTYMTGKPDRYFDINYTTYLANPDQMGERIKDNLGKLSMQARALADKYYSKFFIVDKERVVADSLLGLGSNVRDALANIDVYLADLQNRIVKDGKDPSLVGTIMTTRVRIQRVLSRYKELYVFGQQLTEEMDAATKALDHAKVAKMEQQLKQIGEQLLQEVYLQFDVMLARAGWLQNRMTIFVMYDYTMSLKDGKDFGPYTNDLMFSTGYEALQKLFQVSNISYTASLADLSTAMNIYQTNLETLEDISKDVMQRHIFKLENSSQPKAMTAWEVQKKARANQWETATAQGVPGENDSFWSVVGRRVGGTLETMGMDFFGLNADQYGMPTVTEQVNSIWNGLTGKTTYITSVGNEYNPAKYEKSLLCAQTLGFRNLGPFWAACSKTTLQSPYAENDEIDEITKKFVGDYLSVQYKQKAYECLDANKPCLTPKSKADQSEDTIQEYKNRNALINMSRRRCAVRDYHRRNEVAKVTAALRSDNGTYENEFGKLIKIEIEELKIKDAKSLEQKKAAEDKKAQEEAEQAAADKKAREAKLAAVVPSSTPTHKEVQEIYDRNKVKPKVSGNDSGE